MSRNNYVTLETMPAISSGDSSTTKECIEASTLYLQYSIEKEADKQGYLQDIVNVLACAPRRAEDGQEIFELELGKPLKGKEFILRDKHYQKEYIANWDFCRN